MFNKKKQHLKELNRARCRRYYHRKIEDTENEEEEDDTQKETNADMLMMIKGLWDAHTKKQAEEKGQESKYL